MVTEHGHCHGAFRSWCRRGEDGREERPCGHARMTHRHRRREVTAAPAIAGLAGQHQLSPADAESAWRDLMGACPALEHVQEGRAGADTRHDAAPHRGTALRPRPGERVRDVGASARLGTHRRAVDGAASSRTAAQAVVHLPALVLADHAASRTGVDDDGEAHSQHPAKRLFSAFRNDQNDVGRAGRLDTGLPAPSVARTAPE